jgi:hypothetical protein
MSASAAAAAAAAAAHRAAEGGLLAGADGGEDRELAPHVRSAAVRTRRLLAVADELLEVRLALHADVFVDRHGEESSRWRASASAPGACAAFARGIAALAAGAAADAIRELEDCSGAQFAPGVVGPLVELLSEPIRALALAA